MVPQTSNWLETAFANSYSKPALVHTFDTICNFCLLFVSGKHFPAEEVENFDTCYEGNYDGIYETIKHSMSIHENLKQFMTTSSEVKFPCI